MNNNDIYRQYMYSYPHKTAYREVENVSFSEVKPRIYEHDTHLYVHMPFVKVAAGSVIYLPALAQIIRSLIAISTRLLPRADKWRWRPPTGQALP